MMNLPNLLAIARIVLAPILFGILLYIAGEYSTGGGGSFVSGGAGFSSVGDEAGGGAGGALIHISWLNFAAAMVFALAAITDFFDGYIARKWAQITRLGAILDPLADKMLLLAAFLGLMMAGRADAWAIYLILIREFFITGFRVVMASENVDVSASWAGKIKTVLQMIAAGFLIMQWPMAGALLWVAVAVTLYSGGAYIFAYVRRK